VRELGLDPATPVVLCPGQLRSYKGLSTAVDACARAAGAWQLVVVGRAGPGFSVDALRAELAEVGHAVLVDDHVDDARFGELLAAADLVALPYTGIAGSSVPPAAWAVGTPVVASRLPYFEEILAPGLGDVFEPGSSADLDRVVRAVLSWPPTDVAEATAARTAALDWGVVTTELRGRYARWARTRPIRLHALRTGRNARRTARTLLARIGHRGGGGG
jgi:glycosyltransferase involved in cell wall biosynthesis